MKYILLEIQSINKYHNPNKEYSVDYLLAIASHYIDKNGFKPTSQEKSTKSEISNYFYNMSDIPEDDERIEDKHHVKAHKVIKWFEEIPANSDFIKKVKQIINNKNAATKDFGFLAAAVNLYNKEYKKQVIIRENKIKTNSTWVGNIGEKGHDFGVLTCTKVLTFENVGVNHYRYRRPDAHFYYIYYYFFSDENYNLILYKIPYRQRIQEGTKVKCIADIKAHDEYKGRKQTIIDNPRFENL